MRTAVMLSIVGLSLSGCGAAAPPPGDGGPAIATAPAALVVSAEPAPVSFETWLAGVRREALAQGVSAATLDAAFAGLQPAERVVELDRSQPEFTLTFWRYLGNAVNDRRIGRGRQQLQQNAGLLRQAEARYGVPGNYLVAFWGLETDYGANLGGFPVIQSLATLAYEGRREDFFRRELLTALKILDAGNVSPDRMEGSWAGAMGQMQFMPTTYEAYAVDADGDGRKDIWDSRPDAFGSAAHYLSQLGWQAGQRWGMEVALPAGFDYAQVSIDTFPENWLPIAAWRAKGVTLTDGGALPAAGPQAAVILPAGAEGPAFLVLDNYRRILNWNRSMLYAVAVGYLADRIAGGAPLSKVAPSTDDRLTIKEVEEIQRLLTARGFDTRGVDGRIGPMTRSAIRSYQIASGLPADGYADPPLLVRLRGDAARPLPDAGLPR